MGIRGFALPALLACLAACSDGAAELGQRATKALEAQDYVSAREFAVAALQADPGDPLALDDLARAQLALGQGDEALATLARLNRLERVPPDMRLLVAEGQLQTGNYARALEIVARPQTAEGWRLRALALEQAGGLAAARQAFVLGRNAAGTRYRLHSAEAKHYLDAGDLSRATAALRRAHAEAPDRIEVLFIDARLAQAQADGERALAAFMAILDKAPLDRPALLGAIEELRRKGDVEATRPLVARGLAAMPADAEFAFHDARLLAEDGDWAGVRRRLQARESELRDNPASRTLYAMALLELRQPEQARAHLAPLYRLYPHSMSIRRSYARALLDTGDRAAAREVIAPLLSGGSADPGDRELALLAARVG